MPKLGTAEWWQAHADILNTDETYRKYAKGLNNVFEYNVGDIRTIAKFEDGEIVDVHAAAEGEEGLLVVVAPTQVWADVVSGKTNPKMALVRGKLKLKKGNISTLTRYMAAAGVIFGAMAQVPTED